MRKLDLQKARSHRQDDILDLNSSARNAGNRHNDVIEGVVIISTRNEKLFTSSSERTRVLGEKRKFLSSRKLLYLLVSRLKGLKRWKRLRFQQEKSDK